MTTQEKAVELYHMFLPHANSLCVEVVWGDTEKHHDSSLLNKNAKACAIKCIDQIIVAVDNAADLGHHDNAYWQEVKLELNKL